MSVDTLTCVGTTIPQNAFCSSASGLNPDQQLKRGLLRTDVRLFVSKSWVHGGNIANPDRKYFLDYICLHRLPSIILIIWCLSTFSVILPVTLRFFFPISPLRSLSPCYFPLYDSSLLHFTFLDQERQTSLERTSLQNYMIQPDHNPQLTFHASYTPALLIYLF